MLPLSFVLHGIDPPEIVSEEPQDEMAKRIARQKLFPFKKHKAEFDEYMRTAPESISWVDWMKKRTAKPKHEYDFDPPREGKNTPKPGVIIVKRADEIVMRPKQWIWQGRLMRGAQQMLSGQPGLR